MNFHAQGWQKPENGRMWICDEDSPVAPVCPGDVVARGTGASSSPFSAGWSGRAVREDVPDQPSRGQQDLMSVMAQLQLAIVTCGGPIINLPGGGWTHEDNIVVVAVPTTDTEQADTEDAAG